VKSVQKLSIVHDKNPYFAYVCALCTDKAMTICALLLILVLHSIPLHKKKSFPDRPALYTGNSPVREYVLSGKPLYFRKKFSV
jgi:hypothetical protein